jgi:hypothetical protein
MGWNSWNCFASAVTEKNVRDDDAFVKAGLRDHGWTYLNIDDFWMPKNEDKDPTLHGFDRDPTGKINPNPRFPDMKALTDHIHGLGLKVGLYSQPFQHVAPCIIMSQGNGLRPSKLPRQGCIPRHVLVPLPALGPMPVPTLVVPWSSTVLRNSSFSHVSR